MPKLQIYTGTKWVEIAQRGADGKTPTDQKIISLIQPLIPLPIQGLPGEDATVDLNAIVEEAVKALLDSKPWKDTQKNILYNKFDQRWHGGGSGSVLIADLTSQCNGVTKIFTVPSNSRSIKLESTQFPIIYRPLVDFIVSGVSLTLQAGVGAPETGQTLLFYYVA